MLGVGIGLGDVLALHEEALEGAFDGGIEHVGDAQARLGVERGRSTRFSNSWRTVSSETWR